MKTTYTVILPDGTVKTRKSKREYTHVVAVQYRPYAGQSRDPKTGTLVAQYGDLKWEARSFAANEELAHKAKSQFKIEGGVKQVIVLPIAA
jgi:hypothetical protein